MAGFSLSAVGEGGGAGVIPRPSRSAVHGPRSPWSTLGLAVLGQLGVSMANQGLSAVIPFIEAALALTKSQVGLFSTAGQLGNTISFFGGGWVADTFGVRRLLLFSSGLVALGLFLLSLADSLTVVLAAVFIGGIGTGLGGPAVTMMAIRAFDQRRRGTAMGIKQTGVPAVGMIAAIVIPPVAAIYGWRPAVFAMGLLAIALSGWVFVRYQEEPIARPAACRRPGASGAFGAVLKNPNILVVSLFATGLVALQFCVLSYYILYWTNTGVLNVVAAGQMLAIVQFGGIVGRIFWGLTSDRLMGGRRKHVFTYCGGIATALTFVLAFTGPGTPAAIIAVLSFLIGATALGWHGIYHTLVAELVEPRLAGQAIGVTMTVSQLGPILGPPFFGTIVDATGGAYQPAWLLFGTLAGLVTLALGWVLREAPPGAIGIPPAGQALVAPRSPK